MDEFDQVSQNHLIGDVDGSITVDLEDWRCALDPVNLTSYSNRPKIDEDYLRESTGRLLKQLSSREIKVTFFVLGEVAEAVPELIKEISRQGHEVASHSPIHLPPRMAPREEFRTRLKGDVLLLEEITGSGPRGFRTPYFSVRRDEGWLLSLLVESGFLYDSSVVPTWTPYWGIPFAPKQPYFPDLSNLSRELPRGPILEIPVSVWPTWRRLPGLPMGGGFYMRMWPINILIRMMRMNVRNGIPLVLYIHPGNLETSKDRVEKITLRDTLSQYACSSRGPEVFSRILDEFRFDTLEKVHLRNNRELVKRG